MANRFGFPDIEELDRQQRMGPLSQFEKYPGGRPSQTAPYFVNTDTRRVAVPESIRNKPIEVEVLDDPTQRSLLKTLIGGRLGSSSVEGRSKGNNVMQFGTGIGPEQTIGNVRDALNARQEAERLQAANKRPVFDPSTIPDIYKGQGKFTGSPDVPLPNQITMPNYPNYIDEALKLGANAAKQKNEEGKETNFIDTLLGDIDFKALAQNPIFQQVMGGLQRMPFNQRQFGDSMLTGFTRGVQQFDAEELAQDQLQIARDAEAGKVAENLRRYEQDRADKIKAGDKKLENDLRIALIKNANNSQTKGTNPSEKTLQDIRDYLDDDKFDAVLDNASSDQIAVITRQAGLLLANDINETLPTAIDKAIDIFLKPLASGSPSGKPNLELITE